MTDLDHAVMQHMTHAAGSGADPLTDSLYSQMQPGAEPPLRAGWEDEPADPPHPLLAYLIMFLIFALLPLAGCGGSTSEADEDPAVAVQAEDDAGRVTRQPVDCATFPERCR